ncbi:hypothetical protein Tco_0445986 [Tanacetum coccineum]
MHCISHGPYEYQMVSYPVIPTSETTLPQSARTTLETYATVEEDIKKLINAEAEVVHIIMTGINNDIYSTVDVCPNAKEMWKAIERLMHGENINKQDVKQTRFWAFRKFTSIDGESLEMYYLRFVTIVKQDNDLKVVSYHKLFDILKQHQNEVNEIRAKKLAMNANPLALVATTQRQPVYYPQAKPNYLPQISSTRSHAGT